MTDALYDAAGHVTKHSTGTTPQHAHTYNADGRRVAKGTIAVSSTPLKAAVCNIATNTSFALTESYVLDQDGTQLSTLNQSGTWERTNVYGAGRMIATYDLNGEFYQFTDPLGTRRAEANDAGHGYGSYQSLPFGDQLVVTGDDATPLHYTGKERDTESGNDYFGARYYASGMGRWMSPDPINLTNARLMNPSNTLNKYAYAANNPLKYVDKDGKDITLYYRAPSGGVTDFGHVMVGVLNQDTGKTAFIDFYPKGGTDALGRGPGTFNPGDMSERGAQNASGQFASLTIQTNPEQAQALIDAITKMENGQAPDYSAFLGTNCTTLIEDALSDLGLNFGDQSPSSFWQHAWGTFSDAALDNPFKAFLSAPQAGGHDYGRPRYNNQSQLMFSLYFLQMHPEDDHSSVTTSQGDGVPCGGSTGNPCK